MPRSAKKLADAGAIPIRFPTIRITPMPDTRRLDAALKRLSDYAWIIFTSVNGVAYCWDRLAVVAERACLQALGGGCATPIAAYARRDEDGLIEMEALIASLDGQVMIRVRGRGDDACQLGEDLAREALHQGAEEVLAHG